MRTSERDLTLDQVIAVCIGLHIPPEYSFDLIEKAGKHTGTSDLSLHPADNVYGKTCNDPEAACEMRLQ